MKKIHYLTAGFCLVALLGSGCSKEELTGNLNGHPLDGTWIGIGNAIGYDEDYSIDGITLEITEDGIFTLDDADQDTNDLTAAILVDSEDSMTIKLPEESSSYTMPAGWAKLQSDDTITYEMISDSQLVLTYHQIPYLFQKESSIQKGSFSPLYTLGENNVWYSNDGSKETENTYEFDLYNDYAELYSVSPNQTKALVTNFFYQSNEGETFTFYTNIRKERQLPDLLSAIQEGLGQVNLGLQCDDESLTITYQDNSLTFYNNVIYGLKTDSDSYRLCNKSFQIIDEMNRYFCYFVMDNERQSLYLYICDSDQTNANRVCGEVSINEKKHNWIWYFDKEKSSKTAKKDSELYLKYSAMNGLKVKYKLDGSILHMETKDNKYDLMLTDYVPSEE